MAVRHRECFAIAVIMVAVLLIGEVLVYASDPYSSESTLEKDGDTYTLTISTNYSTEYTVLVTLTDANAEPRHLYIYRDFDYASFIEDSYLDYWIEKMEAEFEVYGFDDYTIIDAEGLREMMGGSLYNETASETALLMLTGVFPDTVYGADESLFEAWLAAGGFVYWSGEPMGMYVGHHRSVMAYPEMVESDPGYRLFGISGAIRTDHYRDLAGNPSEDRAVGKALNIFYDSCNFGVSSAVPDSLFIGNEKDGYNSISISKYYAGDGQICIFGGYFPPSDIQTAHSNILKTFFSGLCYDSEVVVLENSIKDAGDQTIAFNIYDDQKAVVFVMYGSLLGTYGHTYHVPDKVPEKDYS